MVKLFAAFSVLLDVIYYINLCLRDKVFIHIKIIAVLNFYKLSDVFWKCYSRFSHFDYLLCQNHGVR